MVYWAGTVGGEDVEDKGNANEDHEDGEDAPQWSLAQVRGLGAASSRRD